jgi:hypothetical protein
MSVRCTEDSERSIASRGLADGELGIQAHVQRVCVTHQNIERPICRLPQVSEPEGCAGAIGNSDSPSLDGPKIKDYELDKKQAEKQAVLARLAEDVQNDISDINLVDGKLQIQPSAQRVSLSYQRNERPDCRLQEVSEPEIHTGAIANGDSSSFDDSMAKDELGRKQAETQAVSGKFAEDWGKAMPGMILGVGESQIHPKVQRVSLPNESKDEAARRPSQPEGCAGAKAKEVFPRSDVESCTARRAMPYTTPKQEKSRFVSLKDAWSRFNLEHKEEAVFENQVSCSRADVRGSSVPVFG